MNQVKISFEAENPRLSEQIWLFGWNENEILWECIEISIELTANADLWFNKLQLIYWQLFQTIKCSLRAPQQAIQKLKIDSWKCMQNTLHNNENTSWKLSDFKKLKAKLSNLSARQIGHRAAHLQPHSFLLTQLIFNGLFVYNLLKLI